MVAGGELFRFLKILHSLVKANQNKILIEGLFSINVYSY